MTIEFLYLVIGLGLLLIGGEWLVKGSVFLAKKLGISPLVVGLTAVAFGTSTPELVISIMAALEGSTAISFGNVVGSNIANLGMVLGVTCLLRPLVVSSSVIVREIPMLLLCSSAAVILSMDNWLNGDADIITRGDGLILLLLFTLFIYYTVKDVYRQKQSDKFLEDAKETVKSKSEPYRKIIGLIIIGIAGLTIGGNFVVDSAIIIARNFGVPEITIGSTIIAFGTSLPELSACVVSAYRGQSEIALGNIIGSNIFNLLLVLGLTATITPIPVPDKSYVDLIFMMVVTVLLLPMAINHQKTITRGEGVVLTTIYISFIIWQIQR